MKKKVYIILFMLAGLLFQFLLHAMIEMAYINILEFDFAKYSLGMGWDQLMTIHHVLTAVLAILGLAAGYMLGQYWWQVLYIDKKYKQNLKVDF
jgi:hypothetical protein